MFNHRYDGRIVHDMDPIQKIMPYIMKTRTDSMNMFEDLIPCNAMDEYIAKMEAEGLSLSYMHILIAAMVRTLAIRPRLNRFVMNGKIYARPKIWVSFMVHETLREDSNEVTVKLCFEGTETIQEISRVINDAIARETGKKRTANATDKLVAKLLNLPAFILQFVVNVLMFMDRHNCMPKAIIELSPFHTSLFVTNLKSLGINHIYHHVYNFGTTGLFLAMGKEKKRAVAVGNELAVRKQMGIGLVTDERFCDGLYFARSLKKFKRFLENPYLLETPLEAKVEDAD